LFLRTLFEDIMAADLKEIVASLRSKDTVKQQAAAEELARMGEDAQPAAVALVEACGATGDIREWVVAALEGLGPPAVADISALCSLLRNPSLDVAYWGATLLGRLGADAAPAVADLSMALQHHAEPAVRQRVAWALGQIGPAATSALEALRTATMSSNARLKSVATDAIARVRG
jgi:HEAT repeat protein